MGELQNFKDLVKERGFYNKKSQSLILRGVNRGAEKCLNLDSDKRAWVKIEMDSDNDESYQLYLRILNDMPLSENISDAIYNEGIRDYEVFKKNKVSSGAKLFKFLRKKRILCASDIERITTARNTEQLWLCISQNPIDFLFCSSNQSYTSCLDINSDYDGAFYMGLLGLSVDKNRFIAFSTKDKKGFKSELCGKEYTQYKIVSRCWGLLGKNKTFVLEKYYPFKTVGFAKPIREHTGLKFIKKTGDRFYQWRGKYTVPKVYDIKDKFRWVYIDTIGIKHYDYETGEDLKEIMYTPDGNTGNNNGCDYYYALGIKHLKDYKYLKEGAVLCVKCGEICAGDESVWINGETDGYHCTECSKGYKKCGCCDAHVKEEDLTETIRSGKRVCKECESAYFKRCVECNELIYQYDLYKNNTLCQGCYNNLYIKCSDCGSMCEKDKINEGLCVFCKERGSTDRRSIRDMIRNNELKHGMKIRLKNNLENFSDGPGVDSFGNMDRYRGREVTFERITMSGGWIKIVEDGTRYSWDYRWFYDYIELETVEVETLCTDGQISWFETPLRTSHNAYILGA